MSKNKDKNKGNSFLRSLGTFFALPFHPIILVLIPILTLYTKNIDKLPLILIIKPTILALVVVAVVFLLLRLFFRNFLKAAIYTSLLIIIVTSFEELNEVFSSVSWLPNFAKSEGFIFIAWLIIAVAVFVLLSRTNLKLKSLNQFLNIVVLILIFNPLLVTLRGELRVNNYVLNNDGDKNQIEELLNRGQSRPDIYYLIFDRYAGNRTLKEIYNFDNDSFLTSLEQEGFFVANEATTNYPKTLHSLASSLNMSYLELKAKVDEENSGNEKISQQLIHESLVIKGLKNLGYKYYNVGSWWWSTRTHPEADINYIPNEFGLNLDEFSRVFLGNTMFVPALDKFSSKLAANFGNFEHHRGTILFQLDALSTIPSKPSPKFVFAHILAPHDPYVFGKNCENLTTNFSNSRPELQRYLDQLQCTNQRIKDLVAQIKAKSQGEAIIIIQADEGPHPILGKRGPTWNESEILPIQEKFSILSTYYFPDRDYSLLSQNITPVNSFRVVFDKYFKTNLGLLPNKNYVYPNDSKLYEFTDITDRLKIDI